MFIIDEDEPRPVSGTGLEEYALAQAARKRARAPHDAACDAAVDGALAAGRARGVREIDEACAHCIVTPAGLAAELAVATARERLAAHVLQRAPTVLLTESAPAQLYPRLRQERLFDTAAALAAACGLPLQPLFHDLALQHLHDTAAREAAARMADDDDSEDDPLPPPVCEFAKVPECAPGRELEYYLGRYGHTDDYATVARVVLASVTHAPLPECVAAYLQAHAPWVLVSLLTNAGRLDDAVAAACKMVAGDATLAQRPPLQCIDKLLLCLESRASNAVHPDDHSAQLAKTLRDAVEVFASRS